MKAWKFAGLLLIVVGAIALLFAFAFNINFAERPHIFDTYETYVTLAAVIGIALIVVGVISYVADVQREDKLGIQK